MLNHFCFHVLTTTLCLSLSLCVWYDLFDLIFFLQWPVLWNVFFFQQTWSFSHSVMSLITLCVDVSTVTDAKISHATSVSWYQPHPHPHLHPHPHPIHLLQVGHSNSAHTAKTYTVLQFFHRLRVYLWWVGGSIQFLRLSWKINKKSIKRLSHAILWLWNSFFQAVPLHLNAPCW